MLLDNQIYNFRKIAVEMLNYGIITHKEYLKIFKKLKKLEEKENKHK